jgi:oxygen-independent coproporphyrinogen-3 oxidase
LARGTSPAYAREVLDAQARRTEELMLEVRLAEGVDAGRLTPPARRGAARMSVDGLIDQARLADNRLVLTLQGRLLADHVVRELMAR